MEVASRTDRGVSAVGNALRITTRVRPEALLRALNGVSPDLFASAAREVPAGDRIRAALRRRYRYFDPGLAGDLREVRRAAKVLTGDVDVRSFGRGIPSERPVIRTVESIHLEPGPAGLAIQVTAPSFVWGMVRKIVSALREVQRGKLSLARLEDAARGRARLTLPLAEPEGLVLCEVEYATPWTHRWTGPNRRQSASLDALDSDQQRRAAIAVVLREAFGPNDR